MVIKKLQDFFAVQIATGNGLVGIQSQRLIYDDLIKQLFTNAHGGFVAGIGVAKCAHPCAVPKRTKLFGRLC